MSGKIGERTQNHVKNIVAFLPYTTTEIEFNVDYLSLRKKCHRKGAIYLHLMLTAASLIAILPKETGN
tara:strand:+ start:32 stop:235 length:204 start_codon:yes stop_codon:yes gene_type:complete